MIWQMKLVSIGTDSKFKQKAFESYKPWSYFGFPWSDSVLTRKVVPYPTRPPNMNFADDLDSPRLWRPRAIIMYISWPTPTNRTNDYKTAPHRSHRLHAVKWVGYTDKRPGSNSAIDGRKKTWKWIRNFSIQKNTTEKHITYAGTTVDNAFDTYLEICYVSLLNLSVIRVDKNSWKGIGKELDAEVRNACQQRGHAYRVIIGWRNRTFTLCELLIRKFTID